MAQCCHAPTAIANPQTGELLYNGAIVSTPRGDPLTSWGYGVAAGTVAGTSIAAVSAIDAAGATSGTHVLAIVDLTNPRQPVALATLVLPGPASGVQDVVLRDTKVSIGTTTGTLVISIADPNSPQLIGTIREVTGRLAFGDAGRCTGAIVG